jgi:hypothetical protein
MESLVSALNDTLGERDAEWCEQGDEIVLFVPSRTSAFEAGRYPAVEAEINAATIESSTIEDIVEMVGQGVGALV